MSRCAPRSQHLRRSGRPPQQLQLQTLFASGHRPAVVGGEERLEDERKVAQQGFIGAHSPVVVDVCIGAILNQRPFTAANQVTPRLDTKTVRPTVLAYSKTPA